jgi:hypothetical protein
MSEAYECDRCGGLRSGSPYTTVRIAPGLPRAREPEQMPHTDWRDVATVDLCKACQNDLERWYADAGGDRTDVQHGEVHCAEDPEK